MISNVSVGIVVREEVFTTKAARQREAWTTRCLISEPGPDDLRGGPDSTGADSTSVTVTAGSTAGAGTLNPGGRFGAYRNRILRVK